MQLGFLRFILLATSLSFAPAFSQPAESTVETNAVLRAGMVGLDTSHAFAFAKTLNDPEAKGPLARVRVVAALPEGSPDIAGNTAKLERITAQVASLGIEMVDSMDDLLARCDVLMVESVDGRPHFRQALPALRAGKPVFVDKPFAGSLAQGIALADVARKTGTPLFSASSLRFGPGNTVYQSGEKEHPKIGTVVGCTAWSPAALEPHHPDLFWYGIHGVETLFTVMGPGIDTVQRTKTDGADVVVGVWKDARIGTFCGIRAPGKGGYGATVFGTKGIGQTPGFEGYQPLVVEIAKFFAGGPAPVAISETLEILAFMEAADESTRRDGARVKISEVMATARKQADDILRDVKTEP